MQYLPDAKQMKEADQYTIRTLSVPSLDLMERAAKACVRVMKAQGIDVKRPLIVCGSGNNGGDGLAIARLLAKEGSEVTAVMAGNPDHYTEETKAQAEQLRKAGVSLKDSLPLDDYTVVIDALLGVGLSREVKGNYADTIEKMNLLSGRKVAVDIPSGISADSGQVLGTAFLADLTVTFQAVKRGLLLYPGQTYAGEIFPEDIGVNTDLFAPDMEVAGKPDAYAPLLPSRPADSNKGTFGKLLVIAGSKGMSGAAYFNAAAAYRCGAGLVRVYTDPSNREILQTLLPEAIITTYSAYEEEEILRLVKWADAICLGSGIGQKDPAPQIVSAVLSHAEVPVLVDADGLNVLAGDTGILTHIRHTNYIFTPHMKEMSRLTGIDVEEIKTDRFRVLKDFTDQYGITCILKDSRTVIQTGGGRPYINTTGNAAMAKGGSGDVLAGITAGLLAQGLNCTDASLLGAYLQGRCGDAAKEEKGSYSVLARDLIESLSTVLKEEEKKC